MSGLLLLNLDSTDYLRSSQWTTMLDKIEEALDVAGIRYDRLDGTMKRDDRTRAMDALKYDPGCEVLLVSLKAGGVGLNLTAASRVYLMDPYWCVFSIYVPSVADVLAGIPPSRTKPSTAYTALVRLALSPPSSSSSRTPSKRACSRCRRRKLPSPT